MATGERQTQPNLRRMILDTKPDDAGFTPSEDLPNVWGALMEFWVKETVVTLVSLADGTTSMYFSTGGGTIGAGGQPPTAAASKAFVQQAEGSLLSIPEVEECPIPAAGNVAFHLLTFGGYRSIQVPDEEARESGSKFHALRVAGDQVITQIRLHSPK